MSRPDAQGFNKEKLFFLLGATAFAWIFYYFLVSAPMRLMVEPPIGAQSSPAALANAKEDIQHDVDYYISGPKRERKTPFTPVSSSKEKKDPPTVKNTQPPPPPPPEVVKPEPTKNFNPTDLDVQVSFMGVMMYNDKTYALVRFKDGSSPRRVKVGDIIPDLNYTVTAIEKQAIHLVDSEKRPFVIRDSDEIADTTSSSESPTDKPASESSKKPAPKTPAPPPPKANPSPPPPKGDHSLDKKDSTNKTRKPR
ncbi:MAG: hypothetical protein V1899_05820 [Planctomycetota bacterium]